MLSTFVYDLISGLQKLAPHVQKFGLIIRDYVPVRHTEILGT